jgi:hypothetical protein
MPTRQKRQATEPRQADREVKLRVPPPIMGFIEKRAKADRRPINATIVKLLERVPAWETYSDLNELSERYQDMFDMAEITLARYSKEIAWQVLSRELVDKIDIGLQMNYEVEASPSLRNWLNGLRAIRAQMRLQQNQEERTDFVTRGPKR